VVALWLSQVASQEASAECRRGPEESWDDASLLQTKVFLEDFVTDGAIASTSSTTTLFPNELSRASKVKMNHAGDLPTFMSSLAMATAMFLAMVAIFVVLQGWYPEMYAYRATCPEEKRDAPSGWDPSAYGWQDSLLRWIRKSWELRRNDYQEVVTSSGMDAALLLKLCGLGMEIMIRVGGPLFLVGPPLYYFCGGGVAKRHGDRLSSFALGNVADGSRLFWLLSLTVWYVVWYTGRLLFRYQQEFLAMRTEWLKRLPNTRATTLLVKGITDDLC